MKAFSLLFLRIATGLLLVMWGLIKAMAPVEAVHVSDKFYHGVLSMQTVQMPLGIAEIILGVLVVLGLFRIATMPLQTLVLGIGVIAIWKYVLDPFGMYLVPANAREPLFFPSLAVFAASLAQMAFRDDDSFSLDRFLKRSHS